MITEQQAVTEILYEEYEAWIEECELTDQWVSETNAERAMDAYSFGMECGEYERVSASHPAIPVGCIEFAYPTVHIFYNDFDLYLSERDRNIAAGIVMDDIPF